MTESKTLRDEIAMTMHPASLPKANTVTVTKLFCKAAGVEWPDNDPVAQADASFRVESYFRYRYADEMIRARELCRKR